jgi:methionyl-tRNA synthetase
VTPQQYVTDRSRVQEPLELLDISYDKFIRTRTITTSKPCRRISSKLYDQGDIYKSKYTGHYCTPCESFWLDRQIEASGRRVPGLRRPRRTRERKATSSASRNTRPLIQYIKDNPRSSSP